MWGMMHTISKTDFIKMTIKTLESYMCIAAEQRQKFGQEAAKFVCIMDLENFNIRQYAWRPGNYHIRIIYFMSSLNVTLKICNQKATTHCSNKQQALTPFRAELYQIFE
jgi:hypothetical protein